MNKIKAWISAARLRTLPLSISGILVGTALANKAGFEDSGLFIWSLVTTIFFQITSNFANDYGDGVKGTDNAERLGPKRALQSGALGRAELKFGVILAALVSFVSSFILLYKAFGSDELGYLILFLILGICSVWAAIKYTVGESAYGYRGLGDFFVFMFFGLLAVIGTIFLYTKNIAPTNLLPAVGIGLLCVGVLNLNNLRDIASDGRAGKITMVVKMGLGKGKFYHYFLLISAFGCFMLYSILAKMTGWSLVYLIAFTPIFLHIHAVYKNKEPGYLDPELKKLALSTFALALLFYLAINYFL
ncbi:MAG: 1,4-dihydroxy-2-naphthoate octaprenyltransferase [Croceitalea sp.]|nr:1,4-dihydroxy-2-naphthoate octaprenyltransferase [Croceitalea sp.]